MKSEVVLQLLKKSLQEGKQFSFIGEGYSMRPAIPNGAKITIKKEEFNNIKIGDIIFYTLCEDQIPVYCAHRVVFKWKDNLFTKGDAHLNVCKVNKKLILGKVTRIEMNRKIKDLTGDYGNFINIFNLVSSFFTAILLILKGKIQLSQKPIVTIEMAMKKQ